MADRLSLDDALRELYAATPDEFMTRRGELAKTLRTSGDTASASDIAKRRKPTLAAWVVNNLALTDSTVLDRITALGDDLRAAQHALDAPRLRELSAERRKLVNTLSDDAFTRAGREQPAVGLRDEVRSTLDAAVADPDIASRLGVLQRAEQFAGFGFGDAAGPPQLTLVRGGKSDANADTAERSSAPPPKSKPTAAQRKHAREVETARDKLANAGLRVDEAKEREQDARGELRNAEAAVIAARSDLEIAKQESEASRGELKAAQTEFREARRTFDRLEREQP